MYRFEILTRPHYRPSYIVVRVKMRDAHPLCPEMSYDLEVSRAMIRASDGKINRRVINDNIANIATHFLTTYFYMVRTRVPNLAIAGYAANILIDEEPLDDPPA